MFELQLFGANDTITATSEVELKFAFDDGDDRTTKLKNANEVTFIASNVATLSAWIEENQPIVGDKSGTSSTTGIVYAYRVEQNVIKYDLTNNE